MSLYTRLADAQKNTSVMNYKETAYWLRQWRMLAEDALAALSRAEAALGPFASRVYNDGIDAPYPEEEWGPMLQAAHDALKENSRVL